MDNFHILSSSDFNPSIRGYRKRKIVTKSRSGCLTCKVKKVKCDEAKPVCIRCRRNKWRCAYGDEFNHYDQTSNKASPMAENSCAGNILALSSVNVDPFGSPSAKTGTPSAYLLQHCQKYWAEIFFVEPSDEILSVFKSSSLVRNIMLAITASHLRHLSPGDLHHHIAEHFQQSLAIKDYRRSLATPPKELGQSGVNVLVLSATLLSVLAFPLTVSETGRGEEFDPSNSLIFSTRNNRLGWLAFQSGLRLVLRSVQSYFEEAMEFLGPIFLGPFKNHWPQISHGLEEVPERWINFFELDSKSSSTNGQKSTDTVQISNSVISRNTNSTSRTIPVGKIFREPVRIVAYLRNLEPIPINVFHHFTFLAKVHREFRELLYERNEKALWLYGYWFGLMCRFEGLWWSYQRARRDYNAILFWLQHLHLTERLGSEGNMWREMMSELDLAPISYYTSPGYVTDPDSVVDQA